MPPAELIIVGLGQGLRNDDGAGLAAVRAWQAAYPLNANAPGVRVELAELPGVALIEMIAGARAVILVDAVQSGAPAGKIHILSEGELASFSTGSGSAHGLGVAETLALGRKLYPQEIPSHIVLIGIEGASFEPGQTLSPEVQAALSPAARAIQQAYDTLS